ncbi:MAG: TrmH family RNA methyltransferase [Actinomycetota bacterium]
MISSVNNASVKATAKLAKRRERDRRRMCLIEGHRAVSVALAQGLSVPMIFHVGAERKHASLMDAALLAGSKVREVSVAVMQHLTTMTHPPDVVAVGAQRMWSAVDAAAGDFVIVLAAVKDPAVAGGILASAAGAGVTGAISLEGSTDPFAPAAIRAGVGAQFVVRISRDVPPAQACAALRDRDVYWLNEGGERVFSVRMRKPVALVIGDSDAFASAKQICIESSSAVGPGLVAQAAIALYQVEAT